jgi:hypothetical protein
MLRMQRGRCGSVVSVARMHGRTTKPSDAEFETGLYKAEQYTRSRELKSCEQCDAKLELPFMRHWLNGNRLNEGAGNRVDVIARWLARDHPTMPCVERCRNIASIR